MQKALFSGLCILTTLATGNVQAASETSQQLGDPSAIPDAFHKAKPASGDASTTENLNEIVVSALPLGQSAEDIAKPVTVLSGATLDDRKTGTLGETIAKETGVQSSYFGPGAGRPIIRGLDGPRVGVLANGLGTQDVSTVSQDHNVTIEPFLVDQIEILKGPATLLYGNGAIGGVVNTVDGRIPEQLPANGISGRAELSGNTVNDGKTGMARIDSTLSENVALHADGLYRQTGDYHSADGILANSFNETRTGALGGSWVGESGFLGMSVSRYIDRYGNPAEPGDPATGDPPVYLAMRQTRVDFKAGLTQPFSAIDRVMLRVGRTDYQHSEFEGVEPGTRFFSDGTDGRLEVEHNEFAGWKGAFGVQFGRKNIKAIGEESFIPATETQSAGIFWVEQRGWERTKLELGARYDRQSSTPVGSNKVSFSPVSLSAGFIYNLSENWHVNVNLDRAQRALAEEELFANGPHVATNAFEIGDSNLRKETSNQVELGLHFHSKVLEAKLSAYNNRFEDYIFLTDTGQIKDELPVRQWSQNDARFRGFEGEMKWHIADTATGKYDLRIWGDTVCATFMHGGGNVPRVPPSRFGSDLDWTYGNWRAGLGFAHYAKVDRISQFETLTPGYTFINAQIDYTLYSDENSSWEIFANGTNLTNRTAYNSTSFIKDKVPLPGRGVMFGIRALF